MCSTGTEVEKILLDHEDIMIDITDDNNETALHYACYENDIEGVKLFLTHPSCTKDMVGMKGGIINETAEMVAEMMGYEECARLIRDYLERSHDENKLSCLSD